MRGARGVSAHSAHGPVTLFVLSGTLPQVADMMNQHTATGIVFRFLGNPATRESLAELCHAAGIRCACPHRARAFEQQHRLAARPGRPLVVATKDSGSPRHPLCY